MVEEIIERDAAQGDQRAVSNSKVQYKDIALISLMHELKQLLLPQDEWVNYFEPNRLWVAFDVEPFNVVVAASMTIETDSWIPNLL